MKSFIYQEDPGDDNNYVNTGQCSAHSKQQQSEIDEQKEKEDKEEEEAVKRMMIIMRNGNNGDHYDWLNDSDVHPYY